MSTILAVIALLAFSYLFGELIVMVFELFNRDKRK